MRSDSLVIITLESWVSDKKMGTGHLWNVGFFQAHVDDLPCDPQCKGGGGIDVCVALI